MKDQLNEYLEYPFDNRQPNTLLSEEEEKQNLLKILLDTQEELRKRVNSEIQFAPPIIERNGVGIIYPNTINVFQGKTGTHKSRLNEIFLSILLSILPDNSLLGFNRKTLNPDEFHIALVDSERNLKNQFPYAIQQVLAKAKFKDNFIPSNFDFTSLINIPRQKRTVALRAYIDKLRKDFKDKHLIVVIDVVTDCLSSFNNLEESMELIDTMNSIINTSDVTFICVIHENPGIGSNKARGHFGTEVINKASTQIQINYDGRTSDGIDLFKVDFLKTRRSKRPPYFHVYYCQEEKGLVEADKELVCTKESKKAKANVNDVAKYLLQFLIGKMSQKEVIDELIIQFDTSANTIKKRIDLILKDEMIIEGSEKNFRLEKTKEGKENFFELIQIKPNQSTPTET